MSDDPLPGEGTDESPREVATDGSGPDAAVEDATEGGSVPDVGGGFDLRNVVTALAPILLLAVLVGGFFLLNPLALLEGGGEPLPEVSIDTTTLPDRETIRMRVTNNAPRDVRIMQVLVDEAYWDYTITSPGEDAVLGTRESATIEIPYHWTPTFDHELTILTAGGASMHHTITAAHQTPGFTLGVAGTLAAIGFFVGVVPIALGMLWFPAMRRMSDRWLHAVLAFSAGILGFLVFDAGFETFEIAEEVPSSYAGPLLAVLGIGGAFLLMQAVMDWRGGSGESPLLLAYGAAIGIGLHNLAEGLAIGGSFAAGRVSLGAFLVVGFMIHNVTEGPVVVAPMARERRPALWHFGALGLIAGAPAIVGGWIGSLSSSPLLTVLFLSIGVGALLQVIVDIGSMVRRKGSVTSATNLVAFFLGLVVMYATDLFVVV